jgi:hypothetical protein
MLGVAAATALPSEVWPFKKIFLPMAPRIVIPDFLNAPSIHDLSCDEILGEGLSRATYPGRLATPISYPAYRIPLQDMAKGKFVWTPNPDQAEAIAAKYAQGVDVQRAIDAL